MKAIIPVAGAGTKLRPLTYTQPKPLIPVGGKAIISYNIDALIDNGITEFVFVIGYLGEKVKKYIEENYPQIHAHFVLQENRDGLAHAIGLGQKFVCDDEAIIILLGDTIFDTDMSTFIQAQEHCIGVKKVEEPREFGVAKIQNHYVIKLDEKPNIPVSNYALSGLYKIQRAEKLFQAIRQIMEANKKTHGEFQLTDALQKMIDNGEKIKAIEVKNFYDCGRKNVLLETNTFMLKRGGRSNQEAPHYFNSIIIHPVSIAQGVKIENSIVGPNVTIAEHTEILHSIIHNSIIGNNTKMENCVLEKSVIGSDAVIKGLTQSLTIGDNTEIDFSK